ncbi:MAG: von Willebrand factor type A domain-containing protein, partial [Nannocystaceae bacterium]|nr:von Willebrand factor type A domain-containing protein [Nannocystaceae bacterium]
MAPASRESERRTRRARRKGRRASKTAAPSVATGAIAVAPTPDPTGVAVSPSPPPTSERDTEGYNHIQENDFVAVADDPRSTFSIDVDTASYSNSRRFIREGRVPPPAAVRVEELINYFDY